MCHTSHTIAWFAVLAVWAGYEMNNSKYNIIIHSKKSYKTINSNNFYNFHTCNFVYVIRYTVYASTNPYMCRESQPKGSLPPIK